jgi:hypothetical protein
MQGRIGELIRQQTKTRDIRSPAPAFAVLRLRRKTVERDFQRITRFRPFDPDRARDRVDFAEV